MHIRIVHTLYMYIGNMYAYCIFTQTLKWISDFSTVMLNYYSRSSYKNGATPNSNTCMYVRVGREVTTKYFKHNLDTYLSSYQWCISLLVTASTVSLNDHNDHPGDVSHQRAPELCFSFYSNTADLTREIPYVYLH